MARDPPARPPDPAAAEREKLKIKLALLREQHGLTQTDLARRLDMTQPSISQLENSDDLKLSTIAKYVHALDGRLEITAVFGDTSVKLVDDLAETPDLVSGSRIRSRCFLVPKAQAWRLWD